MPINFIEHRLTIGNYQNQSYRIHNTKKTINHMSLKIIKNFQPRSEVTDLPSILVNKNNRKNTSRNSNGIKTSILLLALISQIFPESNALLMDNSSDELDIDFDNISSNFESNTENKSCTHNSIQASENLDDLITTTRTSDCLSFSPTTLPSVSSEHKIELENQRLIHFFKEHGILDNSEQNITKEKLVAYVAMFSELKKQNLKKIAKAILSVSHFYKTEKYLFLSNPQIEKIISEWLFKLVLKKSLTEYLSNHIEKNKSSLIHTISDLKNLVSWSLLEKKGIIKLDNLSIHLQLHFQSFWYKYVLKEMPFFEFDEHVLKETSFFEVDEVSRKKRFIVSPYFWYHHLLNKIKLFDVDQATSKKRPILIKDLAFSNLYSGSRYLSGFHKQRNFTYLETQNIGKNIWKLANTHETSQTYLLTPVRLFKSQYGVSDIIRKQDVDQKSTLNTNTMEVIEEVICRQVSEQIQKFLIDKLKNLKDFIFQWDNTLIRNDTEYNNLVINITNSFEQIDKYLILNGLNSAGKKEKDFILSENAIICPVLIHNYTSIKKFLPPIAPYIYRFHTHRHSTSISSKSLYKEIILTLNTNDLFSVSVENEERIYSLVNKENQYHLFRVDRDLNKYLEANIIQFNNDNYIIKNNEIHLRDKIFTFHLIKDTLIFKQKTDSPLKFINALQSRHKHLLINSIYENRNDTISLLGEMLWQAYKQFIPIYNCIDDPHGDSLTKIPRCLMDRYIFFPDGNEAASNIEKFVFKLIKIFAINRTYLNYFFSDEINIDCLLKKSEPTYKLQNTITNIDPGLNELGDLSLSYKNLLVNSLEKDDNLTFLARKVRSISNNISYKPVNLYQISYLPSLDARVPIKKVGKIQTNDVYALLNPKTGEVGFIPYIIKENDELMVLNLTESVKISEQIKNIITPNFYVEHLDISKLSAPDDMGLMWESNYLNSYFFFKKKFIRIKKVNDELFLSSKNGFHSLIIRNNQLTLEA